MILTKSLPIYDRWSVINTSASILNSHITESDTTKPKNSVNTQVLVKQNLHQVRRDPMNQLLVVARMEAILKIMKRNAFLRLKSFAKKMQEMEESRAYINPYDAGLKVSSAFNKLNSKRWAFQRLKQYQREKKEL